MPPDIRVLHVDDDPAFADLTASMLERVDGGLEVVSETDPRAALDRLTAGDVDCVLADYEMPDVDGLELLRSVSEQHPDLAFILFTGRGSEALASEAIAEGVTDYVQKGSGRDRFAVLANRIRNAVARQRTGDPETRDAATPADEEARVAELAERANDVLWMFDADWGRLLYINRAYEELWGRSIEALHADPLDFLEGIHPDDREAVRREMERLSGGESAELEYRVNAAEDFERWTWVHAEPVRGEDGEVARILGFARDITDRKERERRLEALHDATRRILEAETPEAVAGATSDAVRDTLGYPFNVIRLRRDDHLEPVVVSDEMQLTLGGQRPTYRVGEGTAGRAYAAGETLVYDDVATIDDDVDRGRTRASMYVPIGEHGVLSISDDEPGSFDESDMHLAELLVANVSAALDLLEQRAALTRQNERLDAFASVVSHDLRNPLTVAMGRLELAREEVDSEHLDPAVDALVRMNDLIEDVLTLAQHGRSGADVERLALRPLVDAAWGMAGDGGTLAVDGDLGEVVADEGLLSQLLENLFRNAVEHGGPEVTVRVGRFDDGKTGAARGIYVEDDGPGLPGDLGDRVFEAGVTTGGDSVGLGLSIVREVVDVHGWSIAAVASADGGARFEVTGLSSSA